MHKIVDIYNELVLRWKSESPSFWKSARNLALSIGGGAVAVVMADSTFNLVALGVSPFVFKVAGYAIVFCAAVGLSAQITKK